MNITLYTDMGSAVLLNQKYILLSLLWLGIYFLFLKTVSNKIREKIGFNVAFDKKDLFIPNLLTGATILITFMAMLADSVIISTSYFYDTLVIIIIMLLLWLSFMLFDKYYKKEKITGIQREALVFIFGLLIISLMVNDRWQYEEQEIEVKNFKIVYTEGKKSIFNNRNKENIIILNDKSYRLAARIDLKPGDIVKMGSYKYKNYICTGKKFNICYQAKESDNLNNYK